MILARLWRDGSAPLLPSARHADPVAARTLGLVKRRVGARDTAIKLCRPANPGHPEARGDPHSLVPDRQGGLAQALAQPAATRVVADTCLKWGAGQ